MRRIVTLIMCVWVLASCQESREEAMLRLVNKWNGKEIKFPARSVFTIQRKDTVDVKWGNADYKVVTYIDSVGCTSCKLQLPRWKKKEVTKIGIKFERSNSFACLLKG